jgi:hypothetical protein
VYYIVLTVRDCNFSEFRRVSGIDSENHLESKFHKYIDVFDALTIGHAHILFMDCKRMDV